IPGSSAIEDIVPFPNGHGALLVDGGGSVHVIAINPGEIVSYVKTIMIGDSPQSGAIASPNTEFAGLALIYKAGVGLVRIFFIDLAIDVVTDTTDEFSVPSSSLAGSPGWDLIAFPGDRAMISGSSGAAIMIRVSHDIGPDSNITV